MFIASEPHSNGLTEYWLLADPEKTPNFDEVMIAEITIDHGFGVYSACVMQPKVIDVDQFNPKTKVIDVDHFQRT